jgi:hypothetical protein
MNLNHNQTDGWRKNKDTSSITKEVSDAYPYQVAFCQKLESLFLTHKFRYPKSIEQELGTTFDLIIDKDIMVELECGTKQYDWKGRLPRPSRWPRGLSIPSRKFKDNRWDIYIKFNTDLDSFFAVSWDYLKELGLGKLNYKENVEHNLGYNTNNNFISIGKNYVRKIPPKMTYDSWDGLEKMFIKKDPLS